MELLTILLSLAFVHLWDGRNPVQRDEWYWRWLTTLKGQDSLANNPIATLAVAIGVPVLMVLLALGILMSISYWLLLPVSVLLLLYSFGRGPFEDPLEFYTSAHVCDNWNLGVQQAAELGVNVSAVVEGDWPRLHELVLRAAVYRGFERRFATIFWFLILGPLGAIISRLCWLYKRGDEQLDETPSDQATRWLWLLEWPAVRVLGISFAVTGNFVGCFQRWRDCFFCRSRSATDVLIQAVGGALSMDETAVAAEPVGRRELSALESLYRRTLWLWLGCIGLWAILVS